MKTKNKIQKSKIQQFAAQWKEKYPTINHLLELQYELGIDQAGRGPVMGPMVYSALWWPIVLKQKLSLLGFQDSKDLTEQQRQMLFEVIKSLNGSLFFFEVQVLSAQLLSHKQQRFDAINLNVISHNAAIKLLRSALSRGYKITNVFVDTVGDPKKYQNYIWSRIPEYKDVVKSIVVQPKADRDHKVVSASSICAKVTRDTIVHNWKFSQNIDFKGELGSGYPGDPKTKDWLSRNKNKVFGFPNLIRFSWQTCSNILQNYCILKMKLQNDQERYKGLNGLRRKQQDLFDLVK